MTFSKYNQFSVKIWYYYFTLTKESDNYSDLIERTTTTSQESQNIIMERSFFSSNEICVI